jgi:hypothetical protein
VFLKALSRAKAAKGAMINTGQNDSSTVHAANEKGSILSKLGSAGGMPNAKEL